MNKALQHYPHPQHLYFTFQWRGQAQLLSSETPNYQDLSRSPFFQEDDVLAIPSELDPTTVEILYLFIRTGKHGPKLCQSLQYIEARGIGIPRVGTLPVAGPPCILTPDSNAPPFLLNSILAYNVAKFLSFEPMASSALNRLSSLPFSAEDPIVILERIYLPGLSQIPHDDIRDWVRKWLERRLFTTLGDYAAVYKTNLGVLEQHPQLAERFRKLQYNSAYLLEDTQYVRNYFPVSRGPQTLQTNPAPGLIDWPNNQMPTVQPPPAGLVTSGIYGGTHHPALANNPAWQQPEVPRLPPIEPSWTSGSSVSEPALEDQGLRDQRVLSDELAEFERLSLRS